MQTEEVSLLVGIPYLFLGLVTDPRSHRSEMGRRRDSRVLLRAGQHSIGYQSWDARADDMERCTGALALPEL